MKHLLFLSFMLSINQSMLYGQEVTISPFHSKTTLPKKSEKQPLLLTYDQNFKNNDNAQSRGILAKQVNKINIPETLKQTDTLTKSVDTIDPKKFILDKNTQLKTTRDTITTISQEDFNNRKNNLSNQKSVHLKNQNQLLQNIDLVEIYNPTNMPEKMTKSLEQYTKDLDNTFKNAKKYTKIPDSIKSNLETYIIIDAINNPQGLNNLTNNSITGYQKLGVENISIDKTFSWNLEDPNSQEKLFLGLDTIEEIFKNNPSIFDTNPILLTNYKPTMKNQFMSAATFKFLEQLTTQYPDVQEDILKLYVVQYIKNNHNFTYFGLGDPIVKKPEDILEDQGWPTEKNNDGDFIGKPTDLQKLQACIKTIQELAEQTKKIKIQGVQLSLPKQIEQNIELIKNVYNDPVNTLVKIALPYIEKTIEKLPENINQTPILNEENQEKIQDLSEKIKQKALDLINKEITKEETPIDEQGNEKFENKGQSIESKTNITSFNPEEIRQNPETFIQKITRKISQFFNLSAVDEVAIKETTTQAIKEAQQDKNGWWYAKTEIDTYKKFQIWFHKLMAKCYTLIGKTRDVQTIEIHKDSTDTNTPKITLLTKTIDGKTTIIPAMIEFQGNQYAVAIDSFQPDQNGSFKIRTNLEAAKKFQPFTQYGFNKIIKGSTETIASTPLGESMGKENVQKSFDQLKNSLGTLEIEYNATTKSLTTRTNLNNISAQAKNPYRKENTSTQAPVSIEEQYNLQDQTPIIQNRSTTFYPEKGDIFSPTITIKRDAHNNITSISAQSDNLTIHEKLDSKNLQIDENGNYTIEIQPTTPEKTTNEKIINAAAIYVYEQYIQILSNTATAKSLKDLSPEVMKGVNDLLLQAIPEQAEKITVIYNPTTENATVSMDVVMTNKTKGTYETKYIMA